MESVSSIKFNFSAMILDHLCPTLCSFKLHLFYVMPFQVTSLS